ncbi:MAG: D-alanyl-D-alanine carboxypeptidase [Acidobacteriota bacterium]|nr:D-alanyl-D-alanine carboxypeptidase [Acidobacteriota bacterium]
MDSEPTPFLTPPRAGRRAALRRRRLRRRAGASVGLSAIAVAAALSLTSTSGSATHRGSNARAGADRAASLRARSAVPTSPAGLPLGAPALALGGLGNQAADPVRQYFSVPPRAGLLFNLQTGQVLWQRSPYERLPIASLTKMMTALVTARDSASGALVPVTRQAAAMQGSKVGVLPVGRRVPIEALMYGLMLPSGNDAAVALAQFVAGSVAGFVLRMNQEAARLGMACTRFSNPSGFYDRGNYSCPADLAELAYADLSDRRVASVVRAPTAVVHFPIKGGKLYLTNNNPLLLYGYRGANGVKTGYTEAAGTCLVASAQRGGVRLAVVLLHSPAPGTQAQRLLDDAFQQVYHQPARPEATIPGGA